MFTNREKSTLARWMPTACMIVAAAATGGRAVAASGDGIVVFGTSLSDPGNAFVLTGGTNAPPTYSVSPLLIPDRPYNRGGHHFSNGATWIEQFAVSAGLGESVQAAFSGANPHATNYAVGAARAREDGANVNLPTQVCAFLDHFDGIAPAEATYVIEMGSNDVRDALSAAVTGGNPGDVIQDALTSIAVNIALLHSRGARRFLVWNVPNVALTPAIRMLDLQFPGAAFVTGQLTLVFNAGLNAILGSLASLPGIDIRRLDAYQTVTDMVADPAGFGLTNVTAPCIMPNVAPFACENPDQFLFWDGIHPTTAVHAIVAQRAAVVMAQ
jgi:phospholipase/lecithinase/hemolysin